MAFLFRSLMSKPKKLPVGANETVPPGAPSETSPAKDTLNSTTPAPSDSLSSSYTPHLASNALSGTTPPSASKCKDRTIFGNLIIYGTVKFITSQLASDTTENKSTEQPHLSPRERRLASATDVAIGKNHILFSTVDGHIYSFGAGQYGQCGHGEQGNYYIPVLIRPLVQLKIVSIACGYNFSAAITDTGTLLTWGDNRCGQLAHKGKKVILTPTPVSLLANERIKQVACGTDHMLILTDSGNVLSVGSNASGLLGIGNRGDELRQTHIPQRVGGDVVVLPKIAQVVCSNMQCGALSADGKAVYIWGLTNHMPPTQARLIRSVAQGLGERIEPMHILWVPEQVAGVPVPANAGMAVKQIACGRHHFLFLQIDGSVLSMGLGKCGVLGNGSVNDSENPTLVRALSGQEIASVACGTFHSIAVGANGTVWGWGLGKHGQLAASAPTLIADPVVGTGPIRTANGSAGGGEAEGEPATESLVVKEPRMIVRDIRDVGGLLADDNRIVHKAVCSHTATILLDDLWLKWCLRAIRGEFYAPPPAGGAGTADNAEVMERFIARLLTRPEVLADVQLTAYRIIEKTAPVSRRFTCHGVRPSKLQLDFVLSGGRKCTPNTIMRDEIFLISTSKTDATFMIRVPNPRADCQVRFIPSHGIVPKGGTARIEVQMVVPLLANIAEDESTVDIRTISLKRHEVLEWFELTIGGAPTKSGSDEFVPLPLPSPNTLSPQPRYFYIVARLEVDTIRFPKDQEIDYNRIKTGEILGSGATGVVLKVELDGTPVAVKKFVIDGTVGATSTGASSSNDLRVLRDFVIETKIMSTLDHPNIVRYIGACTQYPNLCLVMEYLPLGSLSSVLRNQRIELPFSLRLKMAAELTAAMQYLHQMGILHRDLKSGNLLVASLDSSDQVPSIKVADFNISRDTRVMTHSITKDQKGTIPWMSPEVLQQQPFTDKSDMYSVGIILWELLTRDFPYHDSPMSRFQFQLEQSVLAGLRPTIPAALPPECPAEYITLMKQCWDANPAKRPSSSEAAIFLHQMRTQARQGVSIVNAQC